MSAASAESMVSMPKEAHSARTEGSLHHVIQVTGAQRTDVPPSLQLTDRDVTVMRDH
jgi:hypothetical protein